MTVPRKKTQRDLRRKEKAEKAAQLDKSIESELKEHLTKGVYGDIYNYPFKEFDTILDMEKDDVALEEEDEEVRQEYLEGDEIEIGDMEDMEDFEGLDHGEAVDLDEDLLDEPVAKKHMGSGSGLKSKRRSTKVITMVEQDEDTNTRLAGM